MYKHTNNLIYVFIKGRFGNIFLFHVIKHLWSFKIKELRGVAQLGSAGALGALVSPPEKLISNMDIQN